MIEEFKIFVDRLKGGHVQKIAGSFDPAFLHVSEEELRFQHPVAVRGEIYVTDDHLVVHLSASTRAEMPCSVCNAMIDTPLATRDFYQTEPLAELADSIYDFGEVVREALLIEIPRTVECNGGKCFQREVLEPYLRSEKREETYLPFADIDLTKGE